MKPSKLIVTFAAAFSLLLATSCKDEAPCDKNCHHGYCKDGDCVCDEGFEGAWCQTKITKDKKPESPEASAQDPEIPHPEKPEKGDEVTDISYKEALPEK